MATALLSWTRRSDTVDAQHVADHVQALQLRYDRASTAFIAKVASVNASQGGCKFRGCAAGRVVTGWGA
ncbi:hypothetical protein [Streptomyces sp. NBC_00233]|uniref:hypothetical protein n=1 Tax=Streptomyces sp. NBC_00233 TaxID=2975686 RepID=UPI0022585C05|nr:hypothetical protein [Streptomyces sp. NBC_00233]MCX5233441.1 hypothetical protein [Streptomyces sp. NBC_00233]